MIKNFLIRLSERLRNPYLLFLIIFISLLFFAITFGDRGWYEPDGVAILAGSLNLEEAKQGNFYLHGYYAQSLAHEINHLIYRLFKNGQLLYILPAICGALGVSLLSLALYFFSKRRINVFFCFCLLLLFPELFYRLLYPNSSVFGMMFFSAALLFFCTPSADIKNFFRQNARFFFVGIFAGLALFCRIDYCFGIPLLFYLIWIRTKSPASLGSSFLGSGIVFAIFTLLGFFKPLEIIRFGDFHTTYFQTLEQNIIQSLAISYTITNIVIWLIIAIYGCLRSIKAVKTREWYFLLAIIPTLFLFYPLLRGLTGGHFVMAAICFGPFVLVRAGEQMAQAMARFKFRISFLSYIRGLVILSIFLQFFSIEAYGKFPFIHIRRYPSFVFTHDGPRYLGAYMKGYADVFFAPHALYCNGMLKISHGLTEVITNSSSDFMVVAMQQRPGNYLLGVTTYVLPFFLQLKGYVLECTEDAKILRSHKNKVIMKNLPHAQYSQIESYDVPESMTLIKIPIVSRKSPQFNEQLRSFYQSFSHY